MCVCVCVCTSGPSVRGEETDSAASQPGQTEEDRHGSLRTDRSVPRPPLLAPTQIHQTAMDCKNTTGRPEETNTTNVETQRDY